MVLRERTAGFGMAIWTANDGFSGEACHAMRIAASGAHQRP